jgi:hypothetical protein
MTSNLIRRIRLLEKSRPAQPNGPAEDERGAARAETSERWRRLSEFAQQVYASMSDEHKQVFTTDLDDIFAFHCNTGRASQGPMWAYPETSGLTKVCVRLLRELMAGQYKGPAIMPPEFAEHCGTSKQPTRYNSNAVDLRVNPFGSFRCVECKYPLLWKQSPNGSLPVPETCPVCGGRNKYCQQRPKGDEEQMTDGQVSTALANIAGNKRLSVIKASMEDHYQEHEAEIEAAFYARSDWLDDRRDNHEMASTREYGEGQEISLIGRFFLYVWEPQVLIIRDTLSNRLLPATLPPVAVDAITMFEQKHGHDAFHSISNRSSAYDDSWNCETCGYPVLTDGEGDYSWQSCIICGGHVGHKAFQKKHEAVKQ